MRTTNKGHSTPAGHGLSETAQPATHTVSQVADEQIARERKYAAKLEDAKRTMLRMSQNAAEQERVFAARLNDAQQVALRMSHSAAERARALSVALRTSQNDLERHLQESSAAEREFRAMLETIQDEARRLGQTIEALTRDVASRDRELADLRDRFTRAVRLLNESEETLLQVIPRLSSLSADTGSGGSTLGLKRLLRLRGMDFLVQAYRVLLHRDPDAGGREHYVGELRKGVATAEIVRRLRYSPEGMKIAVDVREIRYDLFMASLYRTPFVGRLFEAVGDMGLLLSGSRERRAFEHAIALELEQARAESQEASEALLQMAQRIAQAKSDILVQSQSRDAMDRPEAQQPGNR